MGKNLIGACGLFCGACDNYLAFREAGMHLLKTKKYIDQDHNKLKCNGCNSNALSEHCSKCEMKKCIELKELLFCGECSDYPCEKIICFQQDGMKWSMAKHRSDIFKNIKNIKTLGVEKWLTESIKRWECDCGQPFSFYEGTCSNCGQKINTYKTNNEK